MDKKELVEMQKLPYDSPYVESLLLPQGSNILVSFSLELDFDDFEEENEVEYLDL